MEDTVRKIAGLHGFYTASSWNPRGVQGFGTKVHMWNNVVKSNSRTEEEMSISIWGDDESSDHLDKARNQITLLRGKGLGYLFSETTKLINPCERIHSVIPHSYFINRAATKLHEMATAFELFPLFDREAEIPLAVFVCENPGGFVEATQKSGGGCHKICISLTDDKPDTIKIHRNVASIDQLEIFTGGDGTGDVTLAVNQRAFAERVKRLTYQPELKKSTMAVFGTADGGFEVGDRNFQEASSAVLLYSEFRILVETLAPNGCAIIKVFDLFKPDTQKLLWMCTKFFQEVILYKPWTSRVCNSEKYLVLKGFLTLDATTLNFYLSRIDAFISSKGDSVCFNEIKMDYQFKEEMQRYNMVCSMCQAKEIEKAVEMCHALHDNNVFAPQAAPNFQPHPTHPNYAIIMHNRNHPEEQENKLRSLRNTPMEDPDHVMRLVQWCKIYELPIAKQFAFVK